MMKIKLLKYLEFILHYITHWLALKRTRLGMYIYKREKELDTPNKL